jgi:hypothetical protein
MVRWLLNHQQLRRICAYERLWTVGRACTPRTTVRGSLHSCALGQGVQLGEQGMMDNTPRRI